MKPECIPGIASVLAQYFERILRVFVADAKCFVTCIARCTIEALQVNAHLVRSGGG